MSRKVTAAFALWLTSSVMAGESRAPAEILSRRELFVDDFLIERLTGVDLVLQTPRPAGTVLTFDRPWEGDTCDYVTVFEDGGRYRMYYRGSSGGGEAMVPSLGKSSDVVVRAHDAVVCYAESRDGRTWTKPDLGLFEFRGSKANNIVWTGPGGEFSPFLDTNPAAPPAERYKAIGADRPPERVDGNRPVVLGFVSPDGLRWRRLRPEPIFDQERIDSSDVAFWDGLRGRYVLLYRDSVHGVRTFKCAVSPDFLHWSPGQYADFGATPLEHLYTNAALPYFRAPQLYIGLPRRFLPWRTLFADSPEPGASEGVFITSRDGVHWDRRFMEGFIRPGRDARNWVQRSNTPAWGIVGTGPEEISLYVVRHKNSPSNHLERLTLRPDGFVAAHGGARGGELVTRPLVFRGGELVLNYATSAAGGIRLELQDVHGNPLPGFALEETPVLWGDRIDAAVAWGGTGGAERLKRLSGTPVRLRFVLRDADLYSLQFR